ncbi:MAG: discoidin domain-containing protein [Lachnospiraceae bacterium]|nr:discoidin domain-containing protein [Lachnospiraceae bacterium]
MKKRGFALLLSFLLMAAFAACGERQGEDTAPGKEDGFLQEDQNHGNKGTEGDDHDRGNSNLEMDGDGQGEIGDMLTLTALNVEHAPIVDGSGMSGTGGRIHLHSADANKMYKGTGDTFLFDIGHTEKLGELHIWNYNAPGDTGCGLKEVEVSISQDNENYSEPVKYVLAEASGKEGQPATNTLDGLPVDFKGESARYIRIKVLENYGGDGFGLSALRLFRYRQKPVVGESISCAPLERYINNVWSAQPEQYNLTNGSGLNDFRKEDALHDNNPAHMYLQSAKALDFSIDLKGEYPISKIVVWNYNDPKHLDYGVKKFRLKVSDDYSLWTTIGTYSMEQADGTDGIKPSLTIELDNVHAHYVRLEILDTYSGEMVGLSEVSVFMGSGWYCESEPDYTALLSNYNGWAGADGIYTVNLDGKDKKSGEEAKDAKTFFVFSDTILSDVDPVTGLRSNVTMVNNTSALLMGRAADPANIRFYCPGAQETANIVPDPKIPATKHGKFIYYWLGDTFVSGDYLYVYALRIDSVEGVFGFAQIGVDLARYEIRDGKVDFDSLKIINDDKMRLCSATDTKRKWYFGGAVYQSTKQAGVQDPDGYIYIYGYEDLEGEGRRLVVARVLPEGIEDFNQYEYLAADGSFEGEIPEQFLPLAQDVAPECSVTQITSGEHKGKFLFINTHFTNTATIKASIADSPYSVFGNKTTIYVHDTCLAILGKGNNTYNAKAHPALSGEGEVIISYNVNGDDCFKYADIYRPRFLRLGSVKEGSGQ